MFSRYFGFWLGLTVWAFALGASAQPPLQPGEVIRTEGSGGNFTLVRERPGEQEEVIGAIPALDVAVANKHTLYALVEVQLSPYTQDGDEIWKVDVTSGEAEVVATLDHGAPARAIAIEPNGDLLVLTSISGGFGEVIRYDGETFVPEVLTAAALELASDISGVAIATSPDGRIFAKARHEPTTGFSTYEVDPVTGALTPLWSGDLVPTVFGRTLDVDPVTGDLVFCTLTLPGPGVVRASPDGPEMVPTLVDNRPFICPYGPIALTPSGDIEVGALQYGALDVVFPECSNGLDDDGDGLVDFGPGGDADCTSLTDNAERKTPGCNAGAIAPTGTLTTALLALLALVALRRRTA